MEQKLFRYCLDCGRHGELNGIFLATKDEVDAAIGHTVNFGDALGKHSNVHGVLDADEIEELTNDSDFIAKAIEYGLVPTGYNPLDYLQRVTG